MELIFEGKWAIISNQKAPTKDICASKRKRDWPLKSGVTWYSTHQGIPSLKLGEWGKLYQEGTLPSIPNKKGSLQKFNELASIDRNSANETPGAVVETPKARSSLCPEWELAFKLPRGRK